MDALEVLTGGNSGMSLETKVTRIMNFIGVSAGTKGYAYLRRAVILAVEDCSEDLRVTKEIYPGVAKFYKTTSGRVERAIRSSIDSLWSDGYLEGLEELFGYRATRGKPTNSELIALIADSIRVK